MRSMSVSAGAVPAFAGIGYMDLTFDIAGVRDFFFPWRLFCFFVFGHGRQLLSQD